MCREDRRDGRDMLLNIECTHRQHPLVKETNYLLLLQMIEMIEALHHLSYGQSKDTRLIIITIRMDRIHTEMLPHRVKE